MAGDGVRRGPAQGRPAAACSSVRRSTSTGDCDVAWDPFPADLWTKGQRKFVCTFEQEEPGTLAFADITTQRGPDLAPGCA